MLIRIFNGNKDRFSLTSGDYMSDAPYMHTIASMNQFIMIYQRKFCNLHSYQYQCKLKKILF